ncbi:hypothetical protein EIN_362220 [Entamoeba invadens IP1]|uniref:EGF-like domain-containing protein n=1 Tax=Entamoeba invadens IP1 TaxID=370355 RepID=A0A0A1UDV2_ENTIV|nr:hypothetical protein EIN_362220 [Entamoeba invadens IP1]ELP90939.1 hypothetical protein EIN_362220 [Entamoeba invadens IP1]|eukprot:XP_004257710.1 hypothetical protein EIN_362220 [Entamoeba invadens IP1]
MLSILCLTLICSVYSEFTGSYCYTLTDDKNKCQECFDNYILNADKTTCTYKRDLGCESFSGDKCLNCADGYMKDVANTKCVEGDEYCMVDNYSNEMTCNYCKGITNINDKSCKNCTEQNKGCLDANPDCGTCTTCGSGYYLESNKCIRIPNCINKDTTDNKKCGTCINGYYVDDNKNCVLGTIPHCVVYTDKDSCKKCENPYTLVGDNCEYRPYCSYVDQTKCTDCLMGYGLKSGNCTKCEKTNCVGCEADATVCEMCAAGYTIVNGECKKCEVEGCSRCVEGKVSECEFCDVNNGYKLSASTKKCYKCLDHCTQCNEDDAATKCTACVLEYGLNNNKCEKCGTGCASCNENNLNECTYCITGYNLDSTNHKCYKCGENCISCDSSDTATCKTCAYGYALNGKVCKKCDTGCTMCESNDYQKCTYCESGYVLDSANQKCGKCHSSCASCSEGNSDTKCTACPIGYYLTVEGKCLACDGKCDSFNNDADNTQAYCNKCSSICKYTNKGGDDTKCYVNDHCINYDNVRPGKCIDCESGYYVDGQYTCQKCDAKCEGGCVKSATECITYEPIAYCLIYNKDHTCKTCNYGYKKDGNNCIDDDSCQTRNDDAKCIVCEESIGDNLYLADQVGHCKDYVEPTEGSAALAIVMAIFALVLAL